MHQSLDEFEFQPEKTNDNTVPALERLKNQCTCIMF